MIPQPNDFFRLEALLPPRELPMALAHCMVKGRPGTPRMVLLNKIFVSLDLAGAIQCRAELRRCRNAIVDQTHAVVS